MKNIIKKFLKQEHYNKGQIYKVCPSKLLEEFVNFVEDTFIERYKIEPDFKELFNDKLKK